MPQDKFCQDCNQRRRCQKVYQQLAKAQGPSVVLKIITAFLLPLMVFITALVAFEKILTAAITTKQLQTTLSFLLALSVTFVVILIIKVINRQLTKNK